MNGQNLLRKKKAEKGQSLLELAISFIVLLLILGGAIDLGRLLFAYIALRDAAQEGASYASFEPGEISEIRDRVRNTSNTPLDLSDLDDSEITISPITGPYCAGQPILVSVKYSHFKFIMPITSMISGEDGFPLEAKITDTILTPNCN